jgi:hypothetical protein
MLSRVDGTWVPGFRNARNLIRCPFPFRLTILPFAFARRIHGCGYFLRHVWVRVQHQGA